MWLTTTLLLFLGSSVGQDDGQGPGAAPYPDTVYPGFVDPRAAAGAKSYQESPPSYPSPWMDGSGGWSNAYRSAQRLVRKMTLAEKVNITTGVGWQLERCVGQTGGAPRLGFRSMCMQDSPLGVRFADYVSAFPAGGTVAASWDRDVWYDRGVAMGREHQGKGVDAQLGPVVGPLGRAPEGGRHWEGFSPDPVLSGIAVGQSVKGIQAAGVIATTKHYIGNEQEHFRQAGEAQNYGFDITESLSTNIDDTTMHELYLWPFADAVRAGTASIMCSYQQINGSYGCANSYTMNHLLKNELGFQGFIMSDWGAQHSGVGTALAGLDMTMPGDTSFDSGQSFWGTNLTIAVLNGTIPEWRIDDMATRVVAAWYYVGRDQSAIPINFDSWTQDTNGFEHFVSKQGYGLVNEHVNVQADHAAKIRDWAGRSTVLLKNTRGTLPLSGNEATTGVFGFDAGANSWGPNGCSDRGCDNGTLAMGWGSGTANFPFLITPYEAIQSEVVSRGGGSVQGITENGATSQIEALARQASVSLVFVNADSGEGYISVFGNEGDRNNLTLWWDGDNLIKTVANQCKNTIVVVHAVGPVLMTQWHANPNVTGIVWAGLPGEQSGNAIVDILYGKVNPGGKLPFTLGKRRQDYGTDLLYKPNGKIPQDNFKEGVYIDYRAFDKKDIEPIFEFGYGMSYTTFSYSNIQVTPQAARPYIPTRGFTKRAPTLGKAGAASKYVFPSGLKRVPLYVYPYINSTNLEQSSGDPNYGMPLSSFVPRGALSGARQPKLRSGGAPGGNPRLYDTMYTVTATITNTGSVAGDEVVQLYVNLGGPDDPKVVLRNFDRLSIAAGTSRTFTADITRRDLSNWNTLRQDWVVTNHPKTVYVGSSSRNLPLKASLDVGSYQYRGGDSPLTRARVSSPKSKSAIHKASTTDVNSSSKSATRKASTTDVTRSSKSATRKASTTHISSSRTSKSTMDTTLRSSSQTSSRATSGSFSSSTTESATSTAGKVSSSMTA